jgi:hypothetical protein
LYLARGCSQGFSKTSMPRRSILFSLVRAQNHFVLSVRKFRYLIRGALPAGLKADGSEVRLNCLAKTKNMQEMWISALQSEINERNKCINVEKGYYENSFESVILTSEATEHSPNLQKLQQIVPRASLLASKLVRSSLDKC